MSLEVSIALRAEQDMTIQYRWYLENANLCTLNIADFQHLRSEDDPDVLLPPPL